jgi:hypothetical protein
MWKFDLDVRPSVDNKDLKLEHASLYDLKKKLGLVIEAVPVFDESCPNRIRGCRYRLEDPKMPPALADDVKAVTVEPVLLFP